MNTNEENNKKDKKHPIEIILFIIFLIVFIIIPMTSGILWGRDDSKSISKPKTFYGYDCKDDCSGHKAGYEWASDKNITDYNDCTGNSNSFIEGCEAYVDGENNFGNSEY